MKNILKGLIGFFVVVGLIGFVYSSTMTKEEPKVSTISQSYPSDLRGDFSDSETSSQSEDIMTDEEIEALLDEELTPDENFEEFPEEELAEPEAEPATETLNPPAEPQLIASINVKKANMREAPQAKSKIVVVLPRDVNVRVVERGDDWSFCEIDGKQGYIKSRLLNFPEQPAQ